jgi:hypothetical protein
MRNLITLTAALLVISISNTKAQNVVSFSYDGAGNMVQRQVNVSFQAKVTPPILKDSIAPDQTPVFIVFPNPTKDFVNVSGALPDGSTEAKLFLMNISGQVLKTDSYNGEAKSVPVNDLKPGIYFLQVVYSKDHSSNYKIIITN